MEYCSYTFKYKRDLDVKGLRNLKDMTSCRERKGLYFSAVTVTCNESEICYVSPQGNLLIKWGIEQILDVSQLHMIVTYFCSPLI